MGSNSHRVQTRNIIKDDNTLDGESMTHHNNEDDYGDKTINHTSKTVNDSNKVRRKAPESKGLNKSFGQN